MKRWQWFILFASALVCVFAAPRSYMVVHFDDRIYSDINEVMRADVSVILGAGITDDLLPTPVLEERLLAGVDLYTNDKVDNLVVSNTEIATDVMHAYLIEKAVDEADIFIDDDAELTTDSCRQDDLFDSGLEIIFISQQFHLPRALYQCEKLGVIAHGYQAEASKLVQREKLPFLQTFSIRFSRWARESILTWLAVLGIYK